MQASPFFDKLVFNKIKMRLGGKVKAIVSGAAPLAPHVRPCPVSLFMTPCLPRPDDKHEQAQVPAPMRACACVYYVHSCH